MCKLNILYYLQNAKQFVCAIVKMQTYRKVNANKILVISFAMDYNNGVTRKDSVFKKVKAR